MVEKGFISESMRYEYTKSNVTYYEFHVDNYETFQMAYQHLEFGGYLSVQKPEDKNAIMMFGQDEPILRQIFFITSLDSSQWHKISNSKRYSYGDNDFCVYIQGIRLWFPCLQQHPCISQFEEKRYIV